MKITLERAKRPNVAVAVFLPWHSCQPFVENSRAVLIHRPRFVTTHRIASKYHSHLSISFWCGAGSTGDKQFTFLDAPPDGKLLCARCEEKAVQRGRPSAHELVGRHVHLGGVVAVQVCCTKEGGQG